VTNVVWVEVVAAAESGHKAKGEDVSKYKLVSKKKVSKVDRLEIKLNFH